ncbi:MAG TPA: PIN domain-containing protein [Candidatus Saccharimonadales bacterium]|nr:PIN domain-containing protein [Candidatus Saccharimonadales bacterium]
MKVVFDAGVVFAGSGWRSEAYRCLLAMAHRRVIAYATDETLKELSALFADRGARSKHPPATTLTWYQDNVKTVVSAPLGKQRSRDVNDDPYLACALGAGAKIIVTSVVSRN